MSLPILTFRPILKVTPWGGHKLLGYKGMSDALDRVGESWEISGVDGSESRVADGPLKGLTLTELIGRYKARLVGQSVYRTFGNVFPLLIKFIDTDQKLSIQVHPDDVVAQQRGFRNGKTEMWYIVNADADACLLKGFKNVLDKESYVRKARTGEILNDIVKYPVRRGNCFYIPAGQVHAICEGIMLIEVQQTSDTTYRIFDYNRPGIDGRPRQLHLQESLGAVSLEPLENDGPVAYETTANKLNNIIRSPYFETNFVHLTEDRQCDLREHDHFVIIIVFDGRMTIQHDAESRGADLTQGHTALVPAETQWLSLKPAPEGCRFLVVTV